MGTTTLRKLIRALARPAQGPSDTWPVVLLLLAVLLPVACLLWFMSAAMRNERFAARQKLADVYRSQLSTVRTQLEKHWQETAAELETIAQSHSAPVTFAECVRIGRVDSLIVFDEQGRIVYPNVPSRFEGQAREADPKWTEACETEYAGKDLVAAARAYEGLGRTTTNVILAARSFQAMARCLVRAGDSNAAIRVISQTLNDDRFQQVADPQGRLIVGNAQLMALELMTERTSPAFQATAHQLKQRLLDYSNEILAAPQRRFLMKQLLKLAPQIELPTLAAEELPAQVCEHPVAPIGPSALQRAPVPGVWQFLTADRRVLALFRSDELLSRLKTMAALENLPVGAEVELLPPDTDQGEGAAFVTLPGG